MTSSRIGLLVVILPIITTILWNVLDASPSLFVFDIFLKLVSLNNKSNRYPKLHSSTIWLTGASRGIGAAVVCELVAAHVDHVILSSRSTDKMEQVFQDCKNEFPASPTTHSVVYYDALDVDGTQATVQKAIASAPKSSIDVLILNSGIYQIGPALDSSKEDRRKIMRTNYEAPVDLALELVKQNQWKERGNGQIVVVSSVMSKGPHSLCSVYTSSKAALKNYFQSLSTEEWSWLTVNTILPGGIKNSAFWDGTGTNIVPDDPGALVEPKRLAELIMTAMTGPYFLFFETWISKAGGLLYAWEAHYTPTMFYFTNHLVGLARRSGFENDQKDVIGFVNILRDTAGLILFNSSSNTNEEESADASSATPQEVKCGAVVCPTGEVCCNESCGICTPPDGGCIQEICDY